MIELEESETSGVNKPYYVSGYLVILYRNFSNLSKHHFFLFFVSGMNERNMCSDISLKGVSSPVIGETTDFVGSFSAIEGADSASSGETSQLERNVDIRSAHGLGVALILPTSWRA